ncbi:hypothetical protein AJ79_04228 [Helicocarpus griseus UAMH5409]|uniref:Piwi domain-containing protein n=1 Tax=Helicocarpus griseus UAMH5409 TaxID=1447875 RepID=A0A2B7XL64_9EURO|nr:hypothetical protein AJ79_04228 [Helicocarpus griseus UAMH5409]
MSGQQPRGGARGRGYTDRGGGDRGGQRGGRGRGGHPIFDTQSGGRGRGAFRGDDRGRGNRGVFRGGRGGGSNNIKEVFSYPDGIIPTPDPKVKKVEDQYKGAAGPGKELSLESLSINRNFPLRPAYGTQGRPVLLWANYFEMISSSNLSLYRYKVEIKPEQDGKVPSGKKLKRIIELLLEEHFGNMPNRIATDYKATFVCRTALQIEKESFPVTYRLEDEDQAQANPRTYQVRVIAIGSVDVAPLLQYLSSPSTSTPLAAKEDIIQALNIVFGHHPKTDRNIMSVGANKHFPLGRSAESYNLNGGLTALRGFFVSVRAATSRLLVNIQVKATPCYTSGPLPEVMRSFMGNAGNSQMITKLHRFLKRVRVNVTHIPRKNKAGQVIMRIKTIEGLAAQGDGNGLPSPPIVPWLGAGPQTVQFFYEGKKDGAKPGQDPLAGKYVTVARYFETYYPHLPKLNNNLPVVNVGNKQRPIYLPAEVCEVLPGQPANAKLTPNQTQNMIKFAVKRPVENARSIVTNGSQALGVTPQLNAMLTGMGLTMSSKLITVPGRVLDSPTIIEYKGQHTKNPMNGGWNLQNVQFSLGSTVPSWTYLYFTNEYQENLKQHRRLIAENVEGFVRTARSQGLTIFAPGSSTEVVIPQGQTAEDVDLGREFAALRQQKVKLVLVILPFASSPIYNKVKTLGDIKEGIHTVCILARGLAKNSPQYFANVALKFNLKLGGANHRLPPSKLGIINDGKTMVVGIDVTHPAPGSAPNAPSIAGMVASVDKVLAQWPASIRLQGQARAEMVSDLNSMLQSRLHLWFNHNKGLPENILIYRDGVSEGQYGTVLEQELPLLRSACKAVYRADQTKKGLPKITIVIVGKRHNTRFYPIKEADADGSSNPNNGTVVDRGVTETRNWDFFLQAHTALHGTARPGHYYVILDEIFAGKKGSGKFASIADELEDLTHNLCYLFGRATKAVSICPPAYYADLVCERARRYLSHLYDVTPDTSVVSGAGDAASEPTAADVTVHSNLTNTMFYI